MIHTGDISHLSKDEEFDNADQPSKRLAFQCFTCRASTTSSTTGADNLTAHVTEKMLRA